MPNTFPDPYPPVLRSAVAEVWRRHAAEVARLKLTFDGGGAIGSNDTTYFVMVYCNATGADARELVRLMRTLEDEVQDVSGMSVSLELAPPLTQAS